MPDPSAPVDIRCTCGALVARKVHGGIEIRCRRCRHAVVVLGRALADGEVEVAMCPPPRTHP